MANGKVYDGVYVYNPTNAINWALSKVNYPYVWGGGHYQNNRDADSWDCSSFVDAAYFNGYMTLTTIEMASLWRDNNLPGFKKATPSIEKSPRGTILLVRYQDLDPTAEQGGHTAIYLGNNWTIQAISPDSGVGSAHMNSRFTMAFEPLQGSLYIANWQQNFIPSWVNNN